MCTKHASGVRLSDMPKKNMAWFLIRTRHTFVVVVVAVFFKCTSIKQAM